ncbi:DUF2244 domain-containing protein [Fodinicurvata halophila]|uniref:DUF2244 domain-containing protein n=1 Tax=Fodinicurvata halophila TaxID=1419723 RepID=A0ABV8UN47_9PROT
MADHPQSNLTDQHAAGDRRTEAVAEDILFDAVLMPHRSLSPRGFLILMTLIASFGFFAGVGFFLAGAWPVVGFMGLEYLLVYIAFRVNYRRGRMFEQLVLTRDDLVVRRVNHWGEETRWRLQPYWLRVDMRDPPEHDSQLTLRTHGKSLVIGSFLTPDERLSLAQALQSALDRVRSGAAVSRGAAG